MLKSHFNRHTEKQTLQFLEANATQAAAACRGCCNEQTIN